MLQLVKTCHLVFSQGFPRPHVGTAADGTAQHSSSSSCSFQVAPSCLTDPNQASRAVLDSNSSHQAGAALWRLYEAAKPAAAVISSVQAAVTASAAAGSAALGFAAGGDTDGDEATKDAAAAAIHATVSALSEALLEGAGRDKIEEGNGGEGMPRGRAAHVAATAAAQARSLLPHFAAQGVKSYAQEVGTKKGKGEHAEAAASRAAARVISSPWLGLSRSGLVTVLGSLQLDIVKISKEQWQLPGAWTGTGSAGGLPAPPKSYVLPVLLFCSMTLHMQLSDQAKP